MLRLNKRYLTAPVFLAIIAILWQYDFVHAHASLCETLNCTDGGKGTAHVQSQATFHHSGATDSSKLVAVEQQTSLCTDPPRGHCEFYRDCLESRFHCGEAGYPLGYGEKFCNKFVAGQYQLSPAGQKWMMDTMQCLQRVLVPEATEPDTSLSASAKCDALKEKAFDSHSQCYLDNGLCALSGRDWVHIVEIIGVKTLFDSWDAIKESIQAAEGCL